MTLGGCSPEKGVLNFSLSLSPSARRRSLGRALVFPCPPPRPPSPGGVSASRAPLRHRRQAPIPGPLHVCSLTAPRLPWSAFSSLLQVVFTWAACLSAHPILKRVSRFPFVSLGLFLPSAAAILYHARLPRAPPTPTLERRLHQSELRLPFSHGRSPPPSPLEDELGVSFSLLCGPRCPACDISGPQPGVRPMAPALGVSLRHRTSQEVPILFGCLEESAST